MFRIRMAVRAALVLATTAVAVLSTLAPAAAIAGGPHEATMGPWRWASGGGELNLPAMCMDVTFTKFRDGDPVHTWHCEKRNDHDQLWIFPDDNTIRPMSDPTYCLDVKRFDYTPNSQLVIWTCNGGTNQQWLRHSNWPDDPDGSSGGLHIQTGTGDHVRCLDIRYHPSNYDDAVTLNKCDFPARPTTFPDSGYFDQTWYPIPDTTLLY